MYVGRYSTNKTVSYPGHMMDRNDLGMRKKEGVQNYHFCFDFHIFMITVVTFKNCEADGISRRHHGILG